MRQLITIIALIAASCTTTTGPTAPETHQVVVTVTINPDGNPYRDLWVITDMDSILRTYIRDTIDTITMPHGQKIALLWYYDQKPGSMVWTPVTVTQDTSIFFDGELTL